jgi:hypothetical protein
MQLETYSVHMPAVVDGRNAVQIGRVFRIELDAAESSVFAERARRLGATPAQFLQVLEEVVRQVVRG